MKMPPTHTNQLIFPLKNRYSSTFSPLSFLTWNVNGLASRIRQKENWSAFLNLIDQWQPDIICLQEVKLPAQSPIGAKRNDGQPRQRNKIKDNEKVNSDEAYFINNSIDKDLNQYNSFWSLSDWRYSGQLLLTKKNIMIEKLRYNMDLNSPGDQHSPEGRVIITYFPNFVFITTYTPNHGSDETHFERRKQWDIQILNFFESLKNEGKNIIWTGDLNCAPSDYDLSHPQFFRSPLPNFKNDSKFFEFNKIEDYTGYPGCTNIERIRFSELINKIDLLDVFREFNPVKKSPPVHLPHYTWRGHPGRDSPQVGRFYSRAMRLDHFVLSSILLKYVLKIDILGFQDSRVNFFGSDHCPVFLQFKKFSETNFEYSTIVPNE